MAATPSGAAGSREPRAAQGLPVFGLKRGLSIWAAVSLSVALMAPNMAANAVALAVRGGIKAPDGTTEQVASPRLATAGDEPA